MRSGVPDWATNMSSQTIRHVSAQSHPINLQYCSSSFTRKRATKYKYSESKPRGSESSTAKRATAGAAPSSASQRLFRNLWVASRTLCPCFAWSIVKTEAGRVSVVDVVHDRFNKQTWNVANNPWSTRKLYRQHNCYKSREWVCKLWKFSIYLAFYFFFFKVHYVYICHLVEL